MSAARKEAGVRRALRGEDVGTVTREVAVPLHQLND
jgi:hypothetical protein